jgi:glutathione synthase/RimK-type ligase-like ATP-grasp enzyme
VKSPRYILVANPGTKRCETYRRELFAYWAQRGQRPEFEIIPWAEIVARRGNLDDLPAFERPAIVRLESPGKNPYVYRQFLEVGSFGDPAEEQRGWREVEFTKGLLVRPGLWYRGFERVLSGLRKAFDQRPHLQPTGCPRAIATMFDKMATTVLLHAADIPIPDCLEEPADVFAQLTTDSGDRWSRAYLKLRYGSSASGIIALRCGEIFTGVTTLAEIDGQFFNSRLPRDVSGPALQRAADFLLNEGAIAQEGIPMAQLDGQNFDLRVVCLYGKPAATIFRLSRHPMTNLHLGGNRGDFTRCRAAIPNRAWLDAMEHCEAAAALFDSAIAGVDLVFDRSLKNSFVLEVNAFGDFFPWWADARGRSLHSLEIEATAALTPE